MVQACLYDLGLKFAGNNDFKDELKEQLDKLEWESESFVDFCYNDCEEMTLTNVITKLKGIRIFEKNKTKFYLQRTSILEKFGIDEVSDSIKCKDISELEQLLQSEKDLIEWKIKIFKEGLIWDGRRYCWKFKYENKKLYFTKKALPEFSNSQNL